jgi:hypothetical protein
MRVLLLLVSAAAAAAALRRSAGEAGRVLAEGAESGGTATGLVKDCGVGGIARKEPITGKVYCKCLQGYGGLSCKPCAAGTFYRNGNVCLSCPADTYSSAEQSLLCSKCPVGTSTNGAMRAASAEACVKFPVN